MTPRRPYYDLQRIHGATVPVLMLPPAPASDLAPEPWEARGTEVERGCVWYRPQPGGTR